MRVAYQGVPGAFGHAACQILLPLHQPCGVSKFEDVALAVARGDVDAGVLPFKNSYAGEVPAIRELISQYRLRCVDEIDLPVRLHLMGLPGSTVNRLTTVVSHQMAFRQCTGKLAGFGLRSLEAANTARAAMELRSLDTAVLASEEAASIYKLTILVPDMQDAADNRTTFAVVQT